MQLIDQIVQFQNELQMVRRDLHAHPELAYEERRTSDLVAAKLTEWGIPVIRGMGVTGVVGIIKNGNSERAIGIRADMDALAIQEANTFAHASVHEGKMHACGHDGHTAMLLGAARYLATHRNFDGTVYLIFQPAEEGAGGAKRMIEDGLFERCPMDAVFGMHNMPGTPIGTFGVRKGGMLASSNWFDLRIRGRGAHASEPHKSIDPIMAGMHIAQAWQTILTRNMNPIQPAVLSVNQIQGGSAYNAIPDEMTLRGTVRTFTVDALDLIEQRMRTIVKNAAAAFCAKTDFQFVRNYPPLVNHPAETDVALDVMRSIVGIDNVRADMDPLMGAEDFAFMLQEKPGCYVMIGGGSRNDEVSASSHGIGPCELHNSGYDFNDELLPIGATYWVRLVEKFLGLSA
ncbi:MAG: M20 aminoacylase family protein [Noviherbaspirillum sp.]